MDKWARGVIAVAIAIAVVMLASTRAHADRIALPEMHGEADVADEAAAVTRLVRGALARDATLVAADPPITLEHVPDGVDRVVLVDIARDGTGLRATIAIASHGEPEIGVVRVGDGDITALAMGIVEKVAPSSRSGVPPLALGKLRPYAAAARATEKHDSKTAAQALESALPSTVVTLPAAADGLGAIARDKSLPPVEAALAARALGDAGALDEIVMPGDPGAKALAAIERRNLKAAQDALGANPPHTVLSLLAQANLAERRADDAKLATLVLAGLATDHPQPFAAFASTVAPSRLPAPVHHALLALADKPGTESALASRIGLAAAEANVDRDRALGLISVRDIETDNLARLEPLLAATSPAALRLRAELAMRRNDARQAAAIDAFVAAAPTDARAQLYRGRHLAGEGKWTEAIGALDKAGAMHEVVRARVANHEYASALEAIHGEPASAEELVAAARVARKAGKTADANALLARAEVLAPADPVVHLAIADIDPKRAEISKKLAELGAVAPQVAVKTSLPPKPSADPVEPPSEPARAKDAGGASTWYFVGIGVGVAILLIAIWILTASGTVEVSIARPPDASDEVYCVAITRTSARPAGDAVKLHAEVKRAGPTRSRRGGTLVGSPTSYKLSPGPWYVHVYGAYERGGVLRPVPESATQSVEIHRGQTAKLTFDLVPATAELHVQLEEARGKRVGLWVNERDRVYTGTDGKAILTVPVGAHALSIECDGKIAKKAVQVPAPRVQKIVIDLERQMGLSADVAIGSDPAQPIDAVTDQTGANPGSIPPGLGISITMRTPTKEQILARSKKASTDPPNTKPQRAITKDTPIGTPLPPPDVSVLDDLAPPNRPSRPPQQPPDLDQLLGPPMRPSRQPSELAPGLAALMDVELDSSPKVEARAKSPKPATAPPVPMPKSDASIAIDSLEGFELGLPLPPPPPQTGPPKFLGRYTITAELGRGAMGIVHRARDEKLEREVAIKEMVEDLKQYPEALELFIQEAKALARLNHTNIVAMYDQVNEGGKVLMIMEFVDGRTLENILAERGTMPWIEAVSILDQVCAGLAYAHARRIVHRDIKPANIFVAKDRIVKVGDFGLARMIREVSVRRTEVRGTPLYMAPEQIKGEDVDNRTDLYAIGCTLFEAITGRPPFIEGDILYKQVHEAPPLPSEFLPSIPKSLEKLIMALLAKSQADRPATAADVRAAFKELF